MSNENKDLTPENQTVPQMNGAAAKKDRKRLKRGGLSVILVVVVVVAAVLLNIVVTAVSNKYPFSLDLTSNKDYTIQLDNQYREFIQGITDDITITVCAAESDFDDSGSFPYSMVSNLSLIDSYYGSVRDLTNKYSRQTYLFLKTFGTMNSRIDVQFKDANSVTDFAAVKSQYSDETLAYGDIIVSCNHTAENGESYERHQILNVADIFTTQQSSTSSGYSYYYEISGSTLATELTSALYVVVSGDAVNVAVLGGHGCATVASATTSSSSTASGITGLKNLLSKNNYTLTDVNNILTDAIPEDAKLAVIYQPTSDFTADEIKILSDWLTNNGSYGHNLFYMPSSAQPTLPVLEEFLTEWGIQMLPVNAYDETSGSYYYYPYYVMAQVNSTDYTTDFDSAQSYIYPSPYRVAKAAFETNANKTVTSLVTTPDTTVGMPLDAGDSWTKADAEYTGPFDVVLMCSDYGYDNGDQQTEKSNLVMISGDYFLQDEVLTSAAYNSKLVLNLFNTLSGTENTNAVEITEKTISTTSFSDVLINSYAPTFVYIIFAALIPVALIVAGIVVWNVRKKH